MGRIPFHIAAVFLIALKVCAQSSASLLDGTWQGVFHPGPQQLRVVLEIRHTPSGELAATIFSPEQGPEPLRVAGMAVSGKDLIFAVPDVGATWHGTLAADGKSLHGSITQGTDTSSLDFSRASSSALWIDSRIHGTATSVPVTPGV